MELLDLGKLGAGLVGLLAALVAVRGELAILKNKQRGTSQALARAEGRVAALTRAVLELARGRGDPAVSNQVAGQLIEAITLENPRRDTPA